MEIFSWRFIAGVTLIAANYPLGWGGVIAGAALFRKTRLRRWCLAGSGAYGMSWAMLAAGVYLAGPEGMALVRNGGWPVSLIAACGIVAGCAAFFKVRGRRDWRVTRYALMLQGETRLGLTIPAVKR